MGISARSLDRRNDTEIKEIAIIIAQMMGVIFKEFRDYGADTLNEIIEAGILGHKTRYVLTGRHPHLSLIVPFSVDDQFLIVVH